MVLGDIAGVRVVEVVGNNTEAKPAFELLKSKEIKYSNQRAEQISCSVSSSKRFDSVGMPRSYTVRPAFLRNVDRRQE